MKRRMIELLKRSFGIREPCLLYRAAYLDDTIYI